MVGMLVRQSMVGINRGQKRRSNNKVRMANTIDLLYTVDSKRNYPHQITFYGLKSVLFFISRIPIHPIAFFTANKIITY